jgi:polyisoprenoid-binding protein YceI
MIRFTLLLITLLGLLLLCACANPAADQPQAVTGQAAPVLAPAVVGEKFVITPDNSKVEFVASKVTGSHHGAFSAFSGVIEYAGTPENSRVVINIETNSVTTDTPDLTKHLQTADFFDVAKFPQATFVSTEIKPGGNSGTTHTVTGNLQLHGVTRSITFPASIQVSPEAITVDSTFALNRKDFGINYAGAADNLIRDEVLLTLKVRGVK